MFFKHELFILIEWIPIANKAGTTGTPANAGTPAPKLFETKPEKEMSCKVYNKIHQIKFKCLICTHCFSMLNIIS